MNSTSELHKFEGNMASLLHQSETALEDMPELASIAAALSQDKSIANRARKAHRDLQESRQLATESLQQVSQVQQALDSRNPNANLIEIQQQLQQLMEAIPKQLDESTNAAISAKQELEEILDEHDYIKMLLGSGGKATIEQMDVLAFPKTSTAKSNVLTVSGEAGSGKTLCLLAKLIRDVNADQASITDEFQKRALFVCFNTPLASSINSLLNKCLEAFPYAKERIVVQSFDKFVNSLVKANGDFGSYAKDVRFKQSDKKRIHYETSKKDCDFKYTREAMKSVAKRYPSECSEYYLNSSSTANAEWMSEEIRWLQSRYASSAHASDYIGGCERTGRGGKHQPRSDKRRIIVEVWREYEKILKREHLYTIEEAINLLLKSNSLPEFDAIAVDECQDLSVAAVQLLLKMRRSDATLVYIAGDENQKIYSRDFNWKSLDGVTARTTKTLRGNQRNSADIARFANRLLGVASPRPDGERGVQVGTWTDEALLKLIEKSNAAKETIAIIGNASLCAKAKAAGLHAESLGLLSAKGLEFDNVIVDYKSMYAETMEEEKRLRYVHFSRARRRLYVRYQKPVPALLAQAYDDYL